MTFDLRKRVLSMLTTRLFTAPCYVFSVPHILIQNSRFPSRAIIDRDCVGYSPVELLIRCLLMSTVFNQAKEGGEKKKTI